jgi:hypothetical protein
MRWQLSPLPQQSPQPLDFLLVIGEAHKIAILGERVETTTGV